MIDDITVWFKIKIIVMAVLTVTAINIASGQKGAITIGFNWMLPTRTGFTLGYFLSDAIALEAHYGGLLIPSRSYGLAIKYQLIDNNNDFYLLASLSDLVTFPYHHGPWRDSTGQFDRVAFDSLSMKAFHCIGINFGCGYEINIKNNRWKLPLEIGLLGYAREMNIVPNRKTCFPFYPHAGFGITWYSEIEDY